MFKIKTFGCKVNQYESQLMREALISAGYREADSGQKADIYIVNSCVVTQKAEKESRQALRNCIRENKDAKIIAAGCYAEAESEAIRAIDKKIRVTPNRDKANIVDIIKRRNCAVCPERNEGVATAPHPNPLHKGERGFSITYFKGHTRAFVKVQDGCNNFCSYCIVPYVRGRSRSRNPDDILKEARQLVQNGYKELVLTGVCLGDFGKGLGREITLVSLIRKISEMDADFRLRLSSIELPDVTDGLIDEIMSCAKLCHHLHIPLQSGDDDILRKMNRRYIAEELIKRVEYTRSKISDVAITTDVIVGFPGETEGNFNNTLEAIKRIRPSRTHIFTYSPRNGTAAFKVKDDVSAKAKEERYKQLKEVTDNLAVEFKSDCCSRKQRILIESERDRDTGLLQGYTDTYIKLLLDGSDELTGKLIFIEAHPCADQPVTPAAFFVPLTNPIG